ncbi:MAG: 4-alpha-glucanotransferase [Opitutales bacterium]
MNTSGYHQTMVPAWLDARSSGLLLHVSSLPSPFGVGNLGSGAQSFLEFLVEAGFSYWQVCPVGPTGFGDSPYQTYSSVAGNPYFIDWEPLLKAKLVDEGELSKLYSLTDKSTDYNTLQTLFWPLVTAASKRFSKNPDLLSSCYGDWDMFLHANRSWLVPYAFFQALKAEYGDDPWWKWPSPDRSFLQARNRLEDQSLADHLLLHQFLQYVFFGQWSLLRKRAKALGVGILGDIPIYAAPDGAEVWARPDLFQLDENMLPTHVSGVPPDYYAPKGQLWGNPLYDWKIHENEGFTWWLDRLDSQLRLFDVVRIDHFRAFHDYWSVSAEETDACRGHWKKGPGITFFEAVRERFPEMPFLAEDLGLLTKGVHQLRQESGLPGMAVLQFAFDGDPDNLYLPHNLLPETVLYVGTHDNDVANGWYASASEEVRDNFRRYFNVSGDDASWDLVRAAYRSVARLAVVTAQDLLGLGSEARFNVPGAPSGNWRWRLTQSQFEYLCGKTATYLREQTEITGRLPLG